MEIGEATVQRTLGKTKHIREMRLAADSNDQP